MDAARQRIDKWLCYARVVKTRSLAARLVEDGYVRINGARAISPSKAIGIGDVLTIALERRVRVLRIVGTDERRGPFREASLLFEEIGDERPNSPHAPLVR